MRFIHIADVHLGASPDGGRAYSNTRAEELWDSLSAVLDVCEEDEVDLLLIAGDLFHRQPLMRELKELDFLFSKLTFTQVVFIAGNHDYIKPNSYYESFDWSSNVHTLLSEEMDHVILERLDTCIYGFSYHSREVPENKYDHAKSENLAKYEILLAHGGDAKHIPVSEQALRGLGYDYIALGHIHKPGRVGKEAIAYAGALEPIDKNDVGRHGYVKGEITEAGTKIEFVASAKREYKHIEIPIDERVTNGEVKDIVQKRLSAEGEQNMFKLILTGYRDTDIIFDTEGLGEFGNVLDVVDETKPSYDFKVLYEQNRGNILGAFIRSYSHCDPDSIESLALYEGVQAILETKEG